MSNVVAILLTALNMQLDECGNIVGYIHKEKLIDQLNALEANDAGTIRFIAEKRHQACPNGKHYTHMGPQVRRQKHLRTTTPQITTTTITPTPVSLNPLFDDLE